MHELKNLKRMLCEELESYAKRDSLTQNSLEMIDKLAHACKNVCKIIEDGENEEYSMAMSRYDGRGYSRDNYSRDGYYYDDGRSYRRGRDRMGRFISRDSSEMVHKLHKMMDETEDEAIKDEIRRLADKMAQM